MANGSSMSRRRFLRALGLGAAAAVAPRALTGATAAAAGRKPNIIIIFCDDMGYADIGPFGAEGYSTPHLDRMAKEGMTFTDFHVGRSVCSPSRAALMTGCYPVRVGVPGNFGPGSRTGLSPDEVTIADIAKQQGYATAMYGKWHLGHKPKFLPTAQGFDEWFGLPYSNDMWPYHPEQGKRFRFPALPLMEGEEVVKAAVKPADQVHLTTWYAERTVKFIERNKDRPFLIYLPHAMPHVPLFVSRKYKGKTKRGLFGDVIAEIDWGVGQILAALKKHGLDDNTLVVFTSDNGPWLLYGEHAGSAKPLREGKGTSFEGGFRVPCVMRWPGKIPAGKACGELAATMDLLPTVAALIGAKVPADRIIDGKDIRPLMFGRPGAKGPHDAFYYYAGRNLQAVRSGKWKLVLPHKYQSPEPRGKGGQPGTRRLRTIELSLFDLDADVSETTNVAAKHPDVVRRLQALAEQAREDLGDGRRKGKNVRPVGTP
jgi:arylsulfatase A